MQPDRAAHAPPNAVPPTLAGGTGLSEPAAGRRRVFTADAGGGGGAGPDQPAATQPGPAPPPGRALDASGGACGLETGESKEAGESEVFGRSYKKRAAEDLKRKHRSFRAAQKWHRLHEVHGGENELHACCRHRLAQYANQLRAGPFHHWELEGQGENMISWTLRSDWKLKMVAVRSRAGWHHLPRRPFEQQWAEPPVSNSADRKPAGPVETPRYCTAHRYSEAHYSRVCRSRFFSTCCRSTQPSGCSRCPTGPAPAAPQLLVALGDSANHLHPASTLIQL